MGVGVFWLVWKFRKYQYRLISKFIDRNVEVGPGNGSNAMMYIKNCKTLELFEPEKNYI